MMRMIDYECPSCGWFGEKLVRGGEDPDGRTCDCGSTLIRIMRPQPHYKPFHSYFDEGLGVEITGRDHRRRVMRDLGMDFKDHPSKGDLEARKDRAMEQRKELRHRGVRRPNW